MRIHAALAALLRWLAMGSLALIAPGLAAAETIAVAEPVYRDMTQDEAKAMAAKFEQSLQQGGATVIKQFGEGKGGAEFVASLSMRRKGKEISVAAQVTRVKLDAWASRQEASADGHDAAAVDAALNDLASRITGAVRSAPPRARRAPPTPNRVAVIRAKQKAAVEEAKAQPKPQAEPPVRHFTNQDPAESEGPAQDDADDGGTPDP